MNKSKNFESSVHPESKKRLRYSFVNQDVELPLFSDFKEKKLIRLKNKIMSYKAKAKDIYTQLQNGKLLDAFEQYYHQDVVMTEPRGTRKGKDECREYEKQFLSNVKEFHNLEIKNIGSNEEDKTSFVESMMDVSFKDGNQVQMEQVAVQQWKDDHIIKERFYYDNSQ